MGLIITSEHRVGSRWLHYLLSDLLHMKTSPEIDANKMMESLDEIYRGFKENKIIKFHHATPLKIFESIPGKYIIGVVRNPRDRAVSRAFHDFYHPKHAYIVKEIAKTDFEAVKYIVMDSLSFGLDNQRQINELMLDGYSTRNKINQEMPYIWTSYEWLLDDTYREIIAILNFLATHIVDTSIREAIKQHSFQEKTGRTTGEEIRQDTWRRKGVMLDWINWFDNEMTEATRDMQEQYWMKLIKNGGRNEEN